MLSSVASPNVVFCNSKRSQIQTNKDLINLSEERKIPAAPKVVYPDRLNGGIRYKLFIFNKWKVEFVGYFSLHKFCRWSSRKTRQEHLTPSSLSCTGQASSTELQFSPALGSRLHKLHSNHSASPVVERAQTNGLAWLLHSGFPKAAILTLFACSTPSDVLQIWGGVRRAAMKCSFSTAAFMKRLCRGSLPWRNPAQGKLCLIARAAMTLLWKCWNLAHIKEFCAHMLGGAGSKVFSPNSDTLAAQ